MDNKFSFIPETELKKFEAELNSEQKFSPVNTAELIMLYKLFEIGKKIARIEKHVFRAVIPPEE